MILTQRISGRAPAPNTHLLTLNEVHPPQPSLPGGRGQACMLGGVRENRSRKAAPLRVPSVFSAGPVRELHLALVCPCGFKISKGANNKELHFPFSVLPPCGVSNNGKPEPRQVTRKRAQHPHRLQSRPEASCQALFRKVETHMPDR